MDAFDAMSDVNANNYLGTRSLEENLKRFVPRDLDVRPLRPEHKDELLRGLDSVLSESHIRKMWEMLQRRWGRYEALRNN